MDLIFLLLLVCMPVLNYNLAKKRGRNGGIAVLYSIGFVFGMAVVASSIALNMSGYEYEVLLADENLMMEIMQVPMLIGAFIGAGVSVLLALRKSLVSNYQNNSNDSSRQNSDPFTSIKNIDPFAPAGAVNKKPSFCQYCGSPIEGGNCANCGSGSGKSSSNNNW